MKTNNEFLEKKILDSKFKKIPDLIDKKEHCCGCTACYSKCPVYAIEMKADEEGFLYPSIDNSKCICCYQCIKVCVFKRDQKMKGYY